MRFVTSPVYLKRRLTYAERAGRLWPYALAACGVLALIQLLLEDRWDWTLLTRALSIGAFALVAGVVLTLILAVIPGWERSSNN